MPPLEQQAAHDLLHLDFVLGCPGASCSYLALHRAAVFTPPVKHGRLHAWRRCLANRRLARSWRLCPVLPLWQPPKMHYIINVTREWIDMLMLGLAHLV